MLNNRKIIIAPSGALVEVKEVKEHLVIVYQLDDNKNRICQLNVKGEETYLIGILNISKIKNQL